MLKRKLMEIVILFRT